MRSFRFFTRAAGVVGAGLCGSLPVLPLLYFHLLWWVGFILRCELLRTCMLYLIEAIGKVLPWPAGGFSYIQFGFLLFFHAVWRLEEKEGSYVKLIWILCTRGADLFLLPWAFNSKSPPLPGQNPSLIQRRLDTVKTPSSFWKLVCYFSLISPSYFSSVSGGCRMWPVSSMWQYCVIPFEPGLLSVVCDQLNSGPSGSFLYTPARYEDLLPQ